MAGTMAVIGTAGRQDDAARMDAGLYAAMYAETLGVARSWGVDAAVSGGAAWADHLAVRAYLEGEIGGLLLFLPARFERGAFVPDPKVQFNPGATSNRYHAAFSSACGIDSLGEIAQAVERGARVEVFPGFRRRNLEVAASCTCMLAFTFGPPDGEHRNFGPDDEGFVSSVAAGLKDGGTAHTWSEAWRADRKRHVNLFALAAREPAGPPVVA